MQRKFIKALTCAAVISAVAVFPTAALWRIFGGENTSETGAAEEIIIFEEEEGDVPNLTDDTHETESAEFTDSVQDDVTPSEVFEEVPEETTGSEYDSAIFSATEFRFLGTIWWGGWRWTWYSERVLPGGGLNIPGRHSDERGFVCDGNGYICLASSVLVKGTVIETPFGKEGRVYDTGCAYDVVDVYVNW